MAGVEKKFSVLFCMALLFSAGAVLPLREAAAQTPQEHELGIKAGFVYNFALFTSWPGYAFKNDASPLGVCFAGDKTVRAAFAVLQAKSINGRPVTLHAACDNSTQHPCHILYIDTPIKAEAAQVLGRCSGPGVLTVGHVDGFCRLGGIVNFYLENKKLRFEINTAAAERAGLKFSSQLLKLARIVKEETL